MTDRIQRVIVIRQPSHGFHLLMTLLTGGLWIPVWIIVAKTHRDQLRRG